MGIGGLVCALFLCVPFLPDEKLIRLKLQGLEFGVMILLLLSVGGLILQKSAIPKNGRKVGWAVAGWAGRSGQAGALVLYRRGLDAHATVLQPRLRVQVNRSCRTRCGRGAGRG